MAQALHPMLNIAIKAAEQAIINILLEAYPGHGILAEESGRAQGAKDSEYPSASAFLNRSSAPAFHSARATTSSAT